MKRLYIVVIEGTRHIMRSYTKDGAILKAIRMHLAKDVYDIEQSYEIQDEALLDAIERGEHRVIE